MIGRSPTRRRALIAIAASGAALSGAPAQATAPSGPLRIPWPPCAPLCHGPSRGAHISAIYVTTQAGRARPLAIVDVFAAGIDARAVTGQLCYQPTGTKYQPGCSIYAMTHARRVGSGMWWMHFTLPVYQRWQVSASRSHALVRSYWFGVFVRTRSLDLAAAHSGTFTRL
jgi:hypothetical protein